MKIASMKNAIPSMANGRPMTAPNRPIKPGHRIPISKDRMVPDTAPMAKVTPRPFAHRWASMDQAGSLVRRLRHSAIRMSAGSPTPRHARMMCHPSDRAIWARAAARSGDEAAAAASEKRIASRSSSHRVPDQAFRPFHMGPVKEGRGIDRQ